MLWGQPQRQHAAADSLTCQSSHSNTCCDNGDDDGGAAGLDSHAAAACREGADTASSSTTGSRGTSDFMEATDVRDNRWAAYSSRLHQIDPRPDLLSMRHYNY